MRGSGVITPAAAPGRAFELGQRPALDGLRGVAVAIITWHHLRILMPAALPGPDGAFLSVDVFFVLSGFLITSLLLAEHAQTGSISLRSFWRRRVLRLIPAITVFLLVYLLVSALMGDPLLRHGAYALSVITSTFNWVVVDQGTGRVGVLSPLWTLSIEEQFYLCWPPIVGLCLARRRNGRTGLMLLIGVVVVGVALWRVHLVGTLGTTTPYFRTDARVDALLVGAGLAFALHRWGLPTGWARHVVRAGSWGALVVLTVLTAGLSNMTLGLTVGLPVTTVATTFLIVGLLDERWSVSRAFQAPPAIWLGLRSYALYIWHGLVIVLVVFAWPSGPTAVLVLVSIGGSLAVAEASHRYVEAPFRRLRSGTRAAPETKTVRRPLVAAPSPRRAVRTAALAAGVMGLVAMPPALAARTGRHDYDAAYDAARGTALATAEDAPAQALLPTASDDPASSPPASVASEAPAPPAPTPAAPAWPAAPTEPDPPVAMVLELVLEAPTVVEAVDPAGQVTLLLRGVVRSAEEPAIGAVVRLSASGSGCQAVVDGAGRATCPVTAAVPTPGAPVTVVLEHVDGPERVVGTFALEGLAPPAIEPPSASAAGLGG
jgi:peptidoglycan/LPS O-acetylase OafA/YrhL